MVRNGLAPNEKLVRLRWVAVDDAPKGRAPLFRWARTVCEDESPGGRAA